MKFPVIKRVVKEVIFGVVEGLAMYFIFVVGIPWVVSTTLGIPIADKYMVDQLTTFFILGVFVALGVLSSLAKPPIGLVFEILSSLVALLILLKFMDTGVLSDSIEYAGTVINAEFNIRVLLIFFVGFTLLNCVVRMFERLFTMEE